jgi:hypothetical protein
MFSGEPSFLQNFSSRGAVAYRPICASKVEGSTASRSCRLVFASCATHAAQDFSLPDGATKPKAAQRSKF